MLLASALSVGLLVPLMTPQHTQATRRETLAKFVAAAGAGAVSNADAASAARPPVLIDDKSLVLLSKARALRDSTRIGAAARRKLPFDPTPGANNYPVLTKSLRYSQTNVLVPLQEAMTRIASGDLSALPEEQRKAFALQPVLMKGHMFELDQALGSFQFDTYVSKTTKETYPGGKVERELEEIAETCEDFFLLSRGKPPPQRNPGQ